VTSVERCSLAGSVSVNRTNMSEGPHLDTPSAPSLTAGRLPMSIRVLAAAAGWLVPAKYFNTPWGINTAYFFVPARVVCLHCGRFPQCCL
jgi:hypothetical protein